MKSSIHNIFFNEEGCLENKIHKMNLNEFEELFSKNKSDRRKYIMEQYKPYLKKLLETGYVLKHWINGSFVTLKEKPKDIDTFTELDGIKVDEDERHDEIQRLIEFSRYWTDNCCHSLGVFYYPKEYEKEYDSYMYTKTTTLEILFAKNKETNNPKGFVELNLFEGGELDDI